MTRQCIAITLIVAGGLGVAGPTAAPAQPPASLEIPLPENAEVQMEIQVSEDDFLPMIKQVLPQFAGLFLLVAPEELQEALQGLRQVRVLEVEVPVGPKAEDLVTFYEERFTGQQWRRVFWQRRKPGRVLLLLAQEGLEGTFFVSARQGAEKTRLTLVRTLGMANLPQIAALILKKMFSEEEKPQEPPATEGPMGQQEPPAAEGGKGQ